MHPGRRSTGCDRGPAGALGHDRSACRRPRRRLEGVRLLEYVSASGNATDTRDGQELHGSHLALFAESATPALGSDYRFVRVHAVAETAQPLGPFTLRLHGHAGYERTSDPMGVLLSERLFHDGHADVRGYALGSIGSPIGDNAEAIGRAELELPIWRKVGLSITGFADVGVRENLAPSFGPTMPTLAHSVDVSRIWRSPIGPLRLDIAIPLDGTNRGHHLLWSLGAAF